MATNTTNWVFKANDSQLNQTLTKIDSKFQKLENQANRTESKISGIGTKGSKNLSMASQATNRLTSNLSGIINPATLAATAVATIGKATFESLRISKEFNKEFLQVRLLNLDKTQEGLANYRQDLRKTARVTGQGLNETSKAAFDLQSVTGAFGDDVTKTLSTSGKFAKAVNADFNTLVSGLAKARSSFGFGSGQTEDFFASQFATFKFGATTFEQLAQVGADYAGSAAAIGQNYDSANKLFSRFTLLTKSTEEAATLTKSAFQDLFKKSTIKSFEKLGIKVFNPLTKKPKQVGRLIKELNTKFKEFAGNDKKLNNLINQFTGSEGLVKLIGDVAKNGDAVVKTFEDFDKAKAAFNLHKIIQEAEGEIDVLESKIKSSSENLLSYLGDTVEPFYKKLLQGTSSVLDKLNKNQEFEAKGGVAFTNLNSSLNALVGGDETEITGNLKELKKLGFKREDFEKALSAFAYKKLNNKYKSQFDNIFLTPQRREEDKLLLDLMSNNSLIKELTESQIEPEKNDFNITPESNGGGTTFTTSGNRVRNVNVNIQNIIGENIQNVSNSDLDLDFLVEQTTEALIRSIRNSEQILSD